MYMCIQMEYNLVVIIKKTIYKYTSQEVYNMTFT